MVTNRKAAAHVVTLLLAAQTACAAARTGVMAGGVVPLNDVADEPYVGGWEGRLFIDYATPVVPIGLRSGISYLWLDDAREDRRNLNAIGVTAGAHYTLPVTESVRPYFVAETYFYYTTNGVVETESGYIARHEKSPNPAYSIGFGLDLLKSHMVLLEARLTWLCCIAVTLSNEVRPAIALPISFGVRF